MSTGPTLFERALGGDPDAEDADADTDSTTLVDAATGGLAARSTRIDGEEVETAPTITGTTFDDSTQSFLGGQHGRPRPREFWTAKQLGQTPPMQLIKITVAQQLTGGKPDVYAENDELSGGAADVAALIEDIYNGPHYQEMGFDNLITATVSDLVDLAWAYWEIQESADGEFPVASFKPLPPLQIQHEVADDGDTGSDPAYWWVPYQRSGNTISADGDAEGLERDRVVAMRDPQSSRSDSLYGESIATKVREWLELVVDIDVHQKRHFDDSQLPAGFLHFAGNVGDDKLQDVQDDIVEASGDPHDLVTTTSDGDANWIPVGESIVDLDAIQEQQWYFKLVLAAAGLNEGELGIVEGSGFAKELPALQRMLYKKVTKPFKEAIMGPQNAEVVPRITGALSASVDADLVVDIERFDPVQEQIERQETMDEWREKAVSLNELRGGIGREATELVMDIPELGGETNIADLPRYVVDLILDQSPEVTIGEDGSVETESTEGPPDFDSDPVLDEREAFAKHGQAYSERAVKQLEDTIDVQSSFIVSAAYAEETEFMQITFEKPGQNAVYWYGGVERFRFFNFLRAGSKGSYFNKYIRHTGDPGYQYARVQ
jgi:hypothetical protein